MPPPAPLPPPSLPPAPAPPPCAPPLYIENNCNCEAILCPAPTAAAAGGSAGTNVGIIIGLSALVVPVWVILYLKAKKVGDPKWIKGWIGTWVGGLFQMVVLSLIMPAIASAIIPAEVSTAGATPPPPVRARASCTTRACCARRVPASEPPACKLCARVTLR